MSTIELEQTTTSTSTGDGRDPEAAKAGDLLLMRREFAEELPEDCPPLPREARVDPALGKDAGAWVDEYVTYASRVSPMTPRLFHESAALALGAIAIARRLKLPMIFEDIYPNLAVLWLAPTTLWCKSTALAVATATARDVFPHLLAPQDTTPEGLLSDLAGREPAQFDQLSDADKDLWRRERDFAAQRGLILDEMSGLLAAAGKDYNAGLTEALLIFYNCEPIYTRSTRGQGRIVIRNAYITLLGGSTPAAMAPHIGHERLWAMGWWPRFAMLTPPIDKPIWAEPLPVRDLPTTTLRRLYERLPQSTWPDAPSPKAATFGSGAFAAWRCYNKAIRYDLLVNSPDIYNSQLAGTYGRLAVQCLKVALILAALDWAAGTDSTELPVIEMPHLARAIGIVETWRASAHRALATAMASEFDRLARRVVRQVSRHEPKGATVRDIYRGMQDKTPAEIEAMLAQLLKVGEIEKVPPEKGKRGQPTERYRIARGE